MKLIYISFLVIIFPLLVHGQQIIYVTTLHDSINETSGLIYLNQKLITHNDSGGEPILYEFDSISGHVSRAVFISNATNIDWEDLCYDSTYIYIADFGNNNGSRTDLKIYRLPISDYLMSTNDTVTVDTINFSYSDQTNFSPGPFTTNFDAEALISCNDSLYIFTKNWGNYWTNIYALPKTPGTYQIEKIDSINAQGLVTAATYNSAINTILLTGYTIISPFSIEISGFTPGQFSGGTVERYLLDPPTGSSIQIESISFLNQNQYYLTAEESPTGDPTLYRLNTNYALGFEDLEERNDLIYPNPATNTVHIRNKDLSIAKIYNLQGDLLKTSANKQIDISDLPKGLYIFIIKSVRTNRIITTKLVIK